MVQVSLHCPFCKTTRVTKYGTSNGKQRYKCHNNECSHTTFYAEYTYNAYKPDVKQKIIKMAINGNGIRFSKTERMHKIAVGLVINVWYFGYNWLLQ